ncbi:hemerythrin [Natranaerovirga hydrolytica]|uniref:Hemerythrin n=1 Tax=Natranaerovirga hydrolytica TaxID=680378 RepID=A0A4R1MJ09_9FIRM|nr:bacteriohemerythrin [Natranaerovirga hydrolytica]TCK92375.1 hemerythrin [Natranaerovirga hydrolytica]
MALVWNDNMELGIPTIDAQHKKLVELCGEAFDLSKEIEDGKDYYDDITMILTEIKKYTVEHFEYEESLMKEAGYANLLDHEMEHTFFVKKIEKLNKKEYDEPQEQKEFILNLSQVLFDWLSHHILETDKKYVETLK